MSLWLVWARAWRFKGENSVRNELLSQTSVASIETNRTEGAVDEEMKHPIFTKPLSGRNKALYLISVVLWSCGLSKPVATKRVCERAPAQADREQV